MTTQILLPDQLCDDDGIPLAGAIASFFVAATSTPLAVTTRGGTSLGTSITAGAGGRFSQVYTDTLTGVKVVFTDADGATVLTLDPAPEASTTSGTTAEDLAYDPHPDNAATDVQAALDNINNDLYGITATGFDFLAENTALAMRGYLDAVYAAPTDYEDNIQDILETGVYPVNATTTGGWSGIANSDIVMILRNGGLNGFALGFDITAVGTLPLKIAAETAGVWGSYFNIPTTEWGKFTSSAQTITSAGTLTIAHGLGARPSVITAWLVNVTGEHNYTTGQTVSVPVGHDATSGTNNRGFSCRADTTNLVLRFGSDANVFVINDATSGVSQLATNANWTLVLHARL